MSVPGPVVQAANTNCHITLVLVYYVVSHIMDLHAGGQQICRMVSGHLATALSLTSFCKVWKGVPSAPSSVKARVADSDNL